MAKEYTHPELQNLAQKLDEKELKDIASRCLEEYKADDMSRKAWLEQHASWTKIYFQKDKPKNPPWEGSSEESVPMLVEACNQFHARAFQAMFPGRKIIKAIPIGKVDNKAKERATRVGTHMSWQLLYKDRNYKRNKDRLLSSVPLHGSFFTKTFYDPLNQTNQVKNVRAIDLVVPYGTGPRSIEELPRKSELMWMPLVQAKYLAKNGYFVAEPEPYMMNDQPNPVDKASDDIHGFQMSPLTSGIYCRLIEQHRFLDLDGDGWEEPYIVTLDTVGKKVLRVSVRYDTDELGNPKDYKKPVEYYTHYCFMDNPDGFYGLGMGHMLGPINTSANKLLRQTIDAGTLANSLAFTGFISKQAGIKKGEIRLTMGQFQATDQAADSLEKLIWQPKVANPNVAIQQMLELMLKRGDRLGQTTEALTGQTDAVMQPQALSELVEQGLQVWSSVYQRLFDSWEDELSKIYRLNYKYLDPYEYFSVLDVSGELQDMKVARDDYAPDMQVEPIADPKMATDKQKLTKAQAEFQVMSQCPLVMQSPYHLHNVYERYLKAIEVDDINDILPPAIPQTPPIDDPYQENMGALLPMPQMPTVYPNQDHLTHIKAHSEILHDPHYGPMLSQEALALLADHIHTHQALLYRQTETPVVGQTNSIGPQGMGNAAGGAMVLPGANGNVQPGPGMVNGGQPGPAQGPTGPAPNPSMGGGAV